MIWSNAYFKYLVEGWIVPFISLFGFAGNLLSIVVLQHREVKLKRSLVQILCGLATFDNVFLICTFFMFTMPALSTTYQSYALPLIAPYLLPATNTLMTCSVYATVAVATNRYVEMSLTCQLPPWLENGCTQCAIVFFFSVLFNLSRWFELEFEWVDEKRNVTTENGTYDVVEDRVVQLKRSPLRESETYTTWYSMGINSVVMIVIPTVVMIYCSYKVYQRLHYAAVHLSSDQKMQARMKRNQSITRTLFGIILMFLICHTGKIVISVYEVVGMIINGGKLVEEFAPWARYLIVVNTLLVVFNSSTNFVFYCGDVVFRECLSAISKTGFDWTRTRKRTNERDDKQAERTEAPYWDDTATRTKTTRARHNKNENFDVVFNTHTGSSGDGSTSPMNKTNQAQQMVTLNKTQDSANSRIRSDLDAQSKLLLGIDDGEANYSSSGVKCKITTLDKKLVSVETIENKNTKV